MNLETNELRHNLKSFFASYRIGRVLVLLVLLQKPQPGHQQLFRDPSELLLLMPDDGLQFSLFAL